MQPKTWERLLTTQGVKEKEVKLILSDLVCI